MIKTDWRIGDQWWEFRRATIVVRRGHVVGLQTWVLYVRTPDGDKVQAIQHRYGLYPFYWDRTRHIPKRKALDEQVWEEFCRVCPPSDHPYVVNARDMFGSGVAPAADYIMDDHGVAQPR